MRLIDADALKEWIDEYVSVFKKSDNKDIKGYIEHQPTIEPKRGKWIDGDWLLNFFEPYPDDYQTPLGTLRACVDDAPSIDIVRCKECKYDGTWKCRWRNTQIPSYPSADDYCSYGERSEE